MAGTPRETHLSAASIIPKMKGSDPFIFAKGSDPFIKA
jgi:hypothetical protein